MSASNLILAVLLPLAFWAAYHHYHDRHRPEPVRNLILCLLLGAAATQLSLGLYGALGWAGLRYDAFQLAEDSLPGLLLYSIAAIGTIEELAKLVPFVIVAVRFRAFDEPMDGIVYGSFIALGFALVENTQYVGGTSWGEAAARGFGGPIVHIVFASIWAYPIGVAKLCGASIAGAACRWLVVAAIAHGAYDFIVIGMPPGGLLLAAVGVTAIWLWRLRIVRRLSQEASEAV